MAERTHTIPSTSGLMTKRQIREPMYHENLVEKAENFLQQGNQKVNMVGVKGRSAFSCVVPELPLSAPVDYMHCLLLGVYASLLARHMKLLNKKKRIEIDDIMYHVAVSVELSQHGRQPRVFSEVSQFKANEYFNYLFFLAPVVFREFLKPESFQYKSLLRLSFGVRVLLETQVEKKHNSGRKVTR